MLRRELGNMVKKELAKKATGKYHYRELVRRYEETGEGRELLENVMSKRDIDELFNGLQEDEGTASEEQEARTKRALDRVTKLKERGMLRGNEKPLKPANPDDLKSKPSTWGRDLDRQLSAQGKEAEKKAFPNLKDIEVEAVEAAREGSTYDDQKVVGDQMDVEKHFGLNGESFEASEGNKLSMIKGVSANEMPEYLDKLEQSRDLIQDKQLREKRAAERDVRREMAKDHSELNEAQDKYAKPEFDLDYIKGDGSGVVSENDFGNPMPDDEIDETTFKPVEQVLTKGETSFGRIKRAAENRRNKLMTPDEKKEASMADAMTTFDAENL